MAEEPRDSLFESDAPVEAPQSPMARGASNILALGKNKHAMRVIVICGLAVAGILALTFATIARRNVTQDAPVPASMSGASMSPAVEDGRIGNADPALAESEGYKRMAAELAAKAASEAAARGQSAQPNALFVEAGMVKALTPEQQEQADALARKQREDKIAADMAANAASAAAALNAAGGPPAGAVPQNGQQALASQSLQQANELRIAKARAVIAAIAERTPRGPEVFHISTVSTSVQPVNAARSPDLGMPAPGQAASTAMASARQYTLIEAGAVEAARIDTGVNTDRGSAVKLTLLTGKYAGATLVATYTRKGYVADITAQSITFPGRGVTVPATAVVLGTEDLEQGVATDVDRKLIARYGIKPLASGMAAVAEVLRTAGTTVSVNGSTVTTSNELSGKRLGQIVAGSAAQNIATDSDAINTTPTVRAARGTVVALFFTQDVLYTPK